MFSKIVIALASASAGAIGSYIYFKKVKEKEFDAEIKELRQYARDCKKYGDEMREYAEEMYYDLKGDNSNFDKSYEEYVEEKKQKKEAEIIAGEKGIIDKSSSKSKKYIDYTKYYDDYFDDSDPAESEHPTDDLEDTSDKEEKRSNAVDSDIFCITEAEYNDPNSKYLKQELEYYDECGSICKIDYDAANESVLVDNPLYLIGTKWSNSFDEEDYAYIRNNKLKTDFRIAHYQGSYNEIVLGVYDD